MIRRDCEGYRPMQSSNLVPRLAALLDLAEQAPVPPVYKMTLPEARAASRAGAEVVAGHPLPMAAVQDLTIPADPVPIPVRLYRPYVGGRLPLLVFYHGGGWVVGGLDECDGLCRRLAAGAACMVASVAYRLAPEHPFPAALVDALKAVQWLAANKQTLDSDGRLMLAGDSAGGNLAAVVTHWARDAGHPVVSAQILLYPFLDLAVLDGPSYRAYANNPVLSHNEVQWYRDQYVSQSDPTDPCLSPLRADDLSDLPPTLIMTAEFDVLRDDGRRYAQRLADAGVPVAYICQPGMVHGFIDMDGVLARPHQALTEVCAWLRTTLSRED